MGEPHAMISKLDSDLTRWANWRSTFYAARAYHYRSPLADIRDDRGASSSSGAGPSAPRAWGAIRDYDPISERLEHGVRFDLPGRLQRIVCLRYCGMCRPDPAWQHQRLTCGDILSVLELPRQTYYDQLHSAHSRLARYLQARTPLTARRGPVQNPGTPAKVG
jgi:hypothetical protein